MNVNWVKGGHNVRFGTDIYYQALNHTQPEISGGDSFGARGGFRYQGGPTQILGGPGGNLYNAFASFLLGVPNRIGRLKLVEPYTTRNWQVQPLCSRPVAGIVEDHDLVRHAVEYFPVPTRADRGLERYNVDTNQMMIGGVGSVPKDLGVKVSKTLFAPRVGMTYRPTEGLVLRAGFGVTNDPYSLARPLRTNHPGGAEPAARRAEFAGLRQPDVGRHPADSRSGSWKRCDPGAEPDYGLHAARQLRARADPVVERGGSEGAALGLHGRSGLRRHATDRPAWIQGAELVADRRGPGRTPVEPEIRPRRSDPAHRADRRQPVRRLAGATGPPVFARASNSASTTPCRNRPGSPATPTATARSGSTFPSTTISTNRSAISTGRTW